MSYLVFNITSFHQELKGGHIKDWVNIQNNDNEYFRWCLVRCLNPVNKNPAKFRNVDKEKC